VKISGLLSCNNEVPHAKNFTPKTITAQTIVIASTPREARSMSNRLNIRKMIIFGNTHMEIECVIISDSDIRVRYECMERCPGEKI
jgi:hypothetical protein